jgi:predicted nucleic-acid-binding Zn-ribbon protein
MRWLIELKLWWYRMIKGVWKNMYDDKYDVCPECGAENWMYKTIRINADYDGGIAQFEQGQHYVWVCGKCGCEVGGV